MMLKAKRFERAKVEHAEKVCPEEKFCGERVQMLKKVDVLP